MSELPSGWAMGSLNELVATGGLFSDGDWIESKDQDPEGENRLLQLADIGDGIFVDKSSRFVNNDKFQLLSCTELHEGDVLIARMPDPLGRACLMPRIDQRCLTVVDVAVFRSGSCEVSHKLLMHFLNSPQVRKTIEIESSGTTRKRIARGKLAELKLPIPPAVEQTRIAQKLDELLVQVDTLKARIDAIPALLKRFRQSVLAAAVSGRLTEEWRGANSDSGSQDDANLPIGWSLAPLGRYVINYDGARRPISAKERETLKGDHPYYGATGQIDSIDGYTHDGEFVLVGEDGANLLTRAKPIAFIAQGKIWVNNHAHVIASPTGHSNSYLAFYLNTLSITPWVSGSAQPKLNQKNMNEIPVYVPPPEEQTEIVRRVEQLFAFADQLESKVQRAKSHIDHLTQSILAKAFRGELVPQDPNDEPASVLLERIQAQRAAAPKAKRGRKSA